MSDRTVDLIQAGLDQLDRTVGLLKAGTLLTAPVPPLECRACGQSIADGTDGLCQQCRPDAEPLHIATAREIGLPIPATDILPECLQSVFITDGRHWFQGFVGFDGRWWFDGSRPCPDGFVTHWLPEPALPRA